MGTGKRLRPGPGSWPTFAHLEVSRRDQPLRYEGAIYRDAVVKHLVLQPYRGRRPPKLEDIDAEPADGQRGDSRP